MSNQTALPPAEAAAEHARRQYERYQEALARPGVFARVWAVLSTWPAGRANDANAALAGLAELERSAK